MRKGIPSMVLGIIANVIVLIASGFIALAALLFTNIINAFGGTGIFDFVRFVWLFAFSGFTGGIIGIIGASLVSKKLVLSKILLIISLILDLPAIVVMIMSANSALVYGIITIIGLALSIIFSFFVRKEPMIIDKKIQDTSKTENPNATKCKFCNSYYKKELTQCPYCGGKKEE